MVYDSAMNQFVETSIFADWFSCLRDAHQGTDQRKIASCRAGKLGDCEPVSEDVSEMRIHYGLGYRVYFLQRGYEVFILLVGGDKSTQSRDIKIALQLARKLKEAT